MIHEPRGFLGNADGPMNFVGRYTVFAVHDLPHGHEPLVQAQGGIFKNGAGLRGELAPIVTRAALPPVILFKEGDVLGTATRALDAVGPAARYHVFAAIGRIGEVDDGVLKSGEYRFHDSSMPESM